MDRRPAEEDRAAPVPVEALFEGVAAVRQDGGLVPQNEPMRHLLQVLAAERLEELPLTSAAAARLAAGDVAVVAADRGAREVRLVGDGARRWLLASPPADEGPPLASLLRWRRAQRLGGLASAVVHDLANLLLSGIGVAEACRPFVSDRREAEAIAEMEKGARQGAVLCRALARQLRSTPRAWEVTPLAAIAEDAVAIVRKNAAHRGAEMQWSASGGAAVRAELAEAVQAVVQAVLCCLGGGADVVGVHAAARVEVVVGRELRLACLRVDATGVEEAVIGHARRVLAAGGLEPLKATSERDGSGLLLAALAVARAGGELTVDGAGGELRFAFTWPDVSGRQGSAGRRAPPPAAR